MPITRQILRKHRAGEVFVETGTYAGDGVQVALDVGFRQVITMDVDPKQVVRARTRFKGQPVEIWEGPSQEILPKLLESIDEPTTFWLDAHWMGKGTGGLVPFQESQVFSPVLLELEAIARLSRAPHAILIDDMRVFRDTVFRTMEREVISEEVLVKALRDINPDYRIETVNTHVAPNDILVAGLPEKE